MASDTLKATGTAIEVKSTTIINGISILTTTGTTIATLATIANATGSRLGYARGGSLFPQYERVD
jgi:hypothetical protein